MLTASVDALAVFRISRLIVEDRILDRPRNRALAWTDLHAQIISELAACYWCVSPYVAAGVVVARRVAPGVWDPVARILAASAVAGLLSERTG